MVGSFDDFLRGLPSILEADSFRSVARGIASAIRSQRGVVWLLGGHTIKTGLSPVLIRMMERGGATYLVGNGSVAIHDYEVARWGGTSEDVEAGLVDGTFGVAEETGREMNEAIIAGAEKGMGMGEALGWALSRRDDLEAPERSVLLAAYNAAIGQTSMSDFRRMAGYLREIDDGGFVLNVGSAVIMQRCFSRPSPWPGTSTQARRGSSVPPTST